VAGFILTRLRACQESWQGMNNVPCSSSFTAKFGYVHGKNEPFGSVLENVQVAVYYRNVARAKDIPYRGAALRLYGTAPISTTGPERERVWELMVPPDKEQDPEKIKASAR
jgi:hypothetical protein